MVKMYRIKEQNRIVQNNHNMVSEALIKFIGINYQIIIKRKIH